MVFAQLLAAVLAGYLLGSLPFGVLVCRMRGLDPRVVGSGRTGGTNVYRTAGLPAALVTIALDIAKGFAAVELARQLLPPGSAGSAAQWAAPLAGLAAILGHNHSAFVGFRGGAGSTPNVGAILAIDPALFVGGLLLGAVVLVGSRVAALASMTLSGVLAVGLSWRVVDGALPPEMLAYALGQLLLVLWALRPNIRRMRKGQERRFDPPWQRSGSGTG